MNLPTEEMLNQMETKGSNFEKGLSRLYRSADQRHKIRLFICYEDVFEKFQHIIELLDTAEKCECYYKK